MKQTVRGFICALITMTAMASAQESPDSKQVVGKWAGMLRAAGQSPAPAEVEFKPDGTVEGTSNAAQAGLVSYAGRWKVNGDTILVDFNAEGSRGGKSEVSWTLKLEGDELSGSALRKVNLLRYDVGLKRVK
jgi:uncharacterized protein (TIGR03066 family)